MPEVHCTAVAIQNSSEWPCSMCPFPQLRLVGVKTSYIYFSLIFPEHPEFWTPLQIPICHPSFGCTLLHMFSQSRTQLVLGSSLLAIRKAGLLILPLFCNVS